MRGNTVGNTINPEIISWALDRIEMNVSMFIKKFPKLQEWIDCISYPTLNQLYDFSKDVRVPIGYFFCSTPPIMKPPIADFRCFHDSPNKNFSVDLLDMIYLCQSRQDWYKEYAIRNDFDKISFIGKYTIKEDPIKVVENILKTLKISFDERIKSKNLEEAQKYVLSKVDMAEILVMHSGVALGNNNRPLNVKEFRGFALSDDYALLLYLLIIKIVLQDRYLH